MTMRLSTSARNAACAAIVGLLDAGAAGGTIKVYSGSQPATPNTAPTGTLLATFTHDATAAYAAPVNGTAAPDVSPVLSTTGVAAGTPGWFRCADSDGNAVWDGAVGAELTLDASTIAVGQTVQITGGAGVTIPTG